MTRQRSTGERRDGSPDVEDAADGPSSPEWDPTGPDAVEGWAVLDVLGDPDCRAILAELDEPSTATDLATAAGVPRSTTYRKIARLESVSLVDERIRVAADGGPETRYALAVETVRVDLAGPGTFDVDVGRPDADAADRHHSPGEVEGR